MFYTLLEKIEKLNKPQQQQLFEFICDVVIIPYIKIPDGVYLILKNIDQSKMEQINTYLDELLNLDTQQKQDEPLIHNISLSNLRDKIQELSYIEHEQILKFLESRFVSYSQNNNGIFFCLNNLSQKTLNELNTLVNFYIETKKILDQRSIEMSQFKKDTKNKKNYDYFDDTTFFDDVSFSKKLLPNKDIVSSAKTRKQTFVNEQKQHKKSAQINAASEHHTFLHSIGGPLDQVKTEVQKYTNLKKRYTRPWTSSKNYFDDSENVSISDII